jgi:hypothetical protein
MYIVGGDLEVPRFVNLPGWNQFSVVQFSGRTTSENYSQRYYDAEGDLRTDNFYVSHGYYNQREEEVRYCNSCNIDEMSNYYNSLVVPPYFPLDITGQMDRIYSQEELDYLKQIRVEPEYYSIIFR